MKTVSVREFRKNLKIYLSEPCSITSRGRIIASVIPTGRQLVVHKKKIKPVSLNKIPDVTSDIDELIVEKINDF